MYKLKFTKLQNEIFRLLCIKSGESFNQKKIAEMLDVSPPAVQKALPLLEKEGVVKKEKTTGFNLNYITLNRDNPKVMELKRPKNLEMIYESGLSEFLEEKFPGCTIILFGSYSRGDDTVKSDIDIAIIGRKSKGVDLSVYEKRLERTITLNFYDKLNGLGNELKENILNGIVLAGGIDL